MKTLIKTIFTLSIIVLLAACGGGDDAGKKREKLEKLKTRQAEINAEIATLEDELKASGETAESNEKITHVITTTLQPTSFESYIDVQGYVDGDENITIMPKMGGPVTKVHVKAGDFVKKDQLLAEVYNEVQAGQYAALKTNYNLAEDVFNRQKSLWEKGIGSEMQYLQAKAAKEGLEKQLAVVWESMEATRILSPINGTVDDVMLKVGQMASPTMPAFRIVNLNKLKVKADIAESFASKIHEGDEVILRFPDINTELRSKVSFSAKSINPLNRTFGIQVELPEGKNFIPNMIAVVKVINYKNDKAIVVPINSVQRNENTSHVFVASEEKGRTVARKREVVVGATYNDKAEIKSGLNAGDKLITTGYADLNDGEMIKF